jgi:hypothetical protein
MNSQGNIINGIADQLGMNKRPLTTPLNFDLTNPPKSALMSKLKRGYAR